METVEPNIGAPDRIALRWFHTKDLTAAPKQGGESPRRPESGRTSRSWRAPQTLIEIEPSGSHRQKTISRLWVESPFLPRQNQIPHDVQYRTSHPTAARLGSCVLRFSCLPATPMFTIYVAFLVFGGLLLGASVFLGGEDAAGELDAATDLELGEASVDAGESLDIQDNQLDLSGADSVLWPLRTMRFWTFFAAFCGLTGITLEILGLPTQLAAAIAIAIGTGTGGFASWTLRKLGQIQSGQASDGNDYIGKQAQVLVPVRPGRTGKIRVQVRGQTLDMLAIGDGTQSLATHDRVMIIEMQGTRARIVPYEDPMS